jgi:hypothetical protein
LQYHGKAPLPNIFLAVMNNDHIAKEILLASPIRYRLIPDPPLVDPSLQADPSEIAGPPKPEAQTSKETEERVFELQFRRSTFQHQRHIEQHPLYGPFKPITGRYSYITAHLDRVVPDSLYSKGLKDWDSDSVRRKQPGVGMEDNGDGHTVGSRIATRYKEKKVEETPKVMLGLRKLWQQRKASEEAATPESDLVEGKR